ncbi:MAG: glycosyltransferase family 2 protein [Candidatus Omnitrophota bacterium]
MISIIVPVYNEEKNLIELTEKIFTAASKFNQDFEIIFIDDGSTDGSLEAMRKLRDSLKKIRIIKFDRNYGQTSAFDSGFKAARGDIIITLDADLQNDPLDMPRLIEKLKDCDMVYGWRKRRKDPPMKLIASKIGNFIRNKLTGEDIKDTGCSLKAYKKRSLKSLKLFNGMHRFLPTLLKMEGFSVKELEVSHYPRKFGKSKYNTRKRILWPFLDLLAVWWMKKRRLEYKREEV